jgi:hypothetical protein
MCFVTFIGLAMIDGDYYFNISCPLKTKLEEHEFKLPIEKDNESEEYGFTSTKI